MRNAGGDIVCDWKRCTRAQGEWRDAVDVPLNETNERYGLEVWVSSTLVRATQLITPNYSYTQAQQVADTGGVVNNLLLKIWQISDVIGKGYVSERNFSF